MKMRTLILASQLVIAAGVVTLAGCGQKGPLVLPRTPAPAPASATPVAPPPTPAASNTP